MRKTKKLFVVLLVMAMAVANVGLYKVNAGVTDGSPTDSHTEVVEHVEETTEQLTLDLTNGKTATFTTPENKEPIGTVTYYGVQRVLVDDGVIGVESMPTEVTFVELDNPEEAAIKTEKTGATEYTVTAFHTEGMPIVTVPVRLITKKLVNSTTTFTGVTIDGNDAILVGDPDDLANSGQIPSGTATYNYRQDDYYLQTTYTVLFRVGYGEPQPEEEEEKVITEVNITIDAPMPGSETTTELYENSEDDYNWSTQTNRPHVTVPEDANYEVDAYEGDEEKEGYQYTYWMEGYEDDDGYWVPVLGKFEEGKSYIAEFTILAKDGYRFAENVRILVNGEEIERAYEIRNYSIWGAHPVKCEYKADTTEEVQTAEENPETGDNVYVYLVMFGISALVLTSRKVLVK